MINQRNKPRADLILSYILNPAANSWGALVWLKKISWGGSGEERDDFNSDLHEFQVAWDSLDCFSWDFCPNSFKPCSFWMPRARSHWEQLCVLGLGTEPWERQLWAGSGCAVSQIWGGELVLPWVLPAQILTPAQHLSVRLRNFSVMFDVSTVIPQVPPRACLGFHTLL